MKTYSYRRAIFAIVFLLNYFHSTKAQCYSTAWQNASVFTTGIYIGPYNFSSPFTVQTSNNAKDSSFPGRELPTVNVKDVCMVDMHDSQWPLSSTTNNNGSTFYINTLPPGVYFAMNERGAGQFIKQ